MSSLSHKVLASSYWLLIIGFIKKSIGLVSMLILARLLTPDDFGIAAIASLLLFFCDKFANTGAQLYIIQKQDVDDDDLNSAWTLDIFLKGAIWLLLVLLAPVIANYYEREELENVVYFISSILIIRSLANPGLHLLKKTFQYRPIVRINVYQKFISFFIVIAVAYWTRSYWALLIGQVVSFLVMTIASYFVHSYRPQISFKRIAQQWLFSKWVLLKGILGFLKGQIDTILISKIFTIDLLGKYYMVRDLSSLPSQDVIVPAISPLLASFSKVKNEPDKFAYQVSFSLTLVSLIVFPISSFMWFFSQPIVDTLLGEQWSSTAPVLSGLSLLVSTFVFVQLLTHSCIALGKVRSIFFFDLFSLIVMAITLLNLIGSTLAEFAFVRSLLDIFLWLILTFYVCYISKVKMVKLFLMLFPILLSTIVCGLVTKYIVGVPSTIPFVNLLLNGIVFTVLHVVVFFLVYRVYYYKMEEGQHLHQLVFSYLKSNTIFNRYFSIRK